MGMKGTWTWVELLPWFHVSVYSFPEESVKDLIRYLRHEDETRDVRQQLGSAQILQSDLLPILTQHRQDKPLFDTVIRLISPAFFFLIEVWLIYNTVLISAVQQSDLVIHTCIYMYVYIYTHCFVYFLSLWLITGC